MGTAWGEHEAYAGSIRPHTLTVGTRRRDVNSRG